jgi:hypothetical protein
MAFERKLAAVSPQAFTANGTAQGLITIASTAGFYIKQFVYLQSNTILSAGFQVKNILSDTQLVLGPPNNSLNAPLNPTDLSGYLVADGATISAPEQNNFPIKPDDHYLAVFMPAPIQADRVIDVDPYGNPYGPDNPYPVSFDGTISIGEVTVVGTAPDHYPLEPNANGSINVELEPGSDVTIVGTGPNYYPLQPNVDGSIDVDLQGLTAFQTEQYTINTSAVQITPIPMPERSSIGFKAICTSSTDAVYIGNSSAVTVSTGYPLFSHDTLEMDLEGTDTIYAIGTSAGQTLCVIELGD